MHHHLKAIFLFLIKTQYFNIVSRIELIEIQGGKVIVKKTWTY